MYGTKASELISHIHREQGDLIPPYEYQLIEDIKRENEELYAENLRTSQSATTRSKIPDQNLEDQPGPSSYTNGTKEAETRTQKHVENKDLTNAHDDIDISDIEIMVMQVRHTAKLWNKRCIIAYHHERLNRLKRLRWEYGNNLPREIVQNLTEDELEWFTKYNDNLFSYMNALNDGQGIDLTLHMRPPKRLNVQFKCLKDYGQFEIDGELKLLKKDNLYYFPLSHCEKLIHQGVLEHIKM